MDAKEKKARVRVFNKRPMVLVAAGCFLGALLSYFGLLIGASLVVIIVVSVAAVVIGILVRKKKFAIFLCALALFVFFTTFVTMSARLPLAFSKVQANISGRVVEVKASSTGNYKVLLENATIEGISVGGKMDLTVKRSEDLQVGDLVEFTGKCEAITPFLQSYHLGLLAEDVRYVAETEEFLAQTRGETNFLEKIQARIANAVLTVMPRDDAGISLSLLFGDKSHLAAEDYAAVKASGTAHVFAVSGLHVGFLVGAVVWLLKKLKCKKGAIFLSVSGLLVVYGFLCGFPSSFLRAAFMCVVLLFSDIGRRRYDALSALAFSAVVILLFDPVSLFSVGFQMSFAALLGITLLYRPIKKGLTKAVKWNALASSLALSLSSTLGILPVTTAYFGTFSTYFLLSNLLVVPLVAVTYLMLAVALIPAMISVSACGFLLYPGMYLVRTLAAVTSFFASLPFSLVTVTSFPLCALGYYGALVAASPFCLVQKKKKLCIFAVFSAVILILFAIFTALPAAA